MNSLYDLLKTIFESELSATRKLFPKRAWRKLTGLAARSPVFCPDGRRIVRSLTARHAGSLC